MSYVNWSGHERLCATPCAGRYQGMFDVHDVLHEDTHGRTEYFQCTLPSTSRTSNEAKEVPRLARLGCSYIYVRAYA